VTDDAMTRSEEQLRVGTETVEAGRAWLRKYVVTENVSTTVPVSHEEVRVVTLRAERPVVAKEALPVERVRLTTETVTEDAAVNETVRKEQVEEPGVEGSPREAGR
jgi:stress response protein YsnF